MLHSQQPREKATSPWIITEQSGKVLAAHCDCMAGLGEVCKSSPIKPPKSLIKKICYPEACRFHADATQWGCDHEDKAKEQYKREMTSCHENFEVREAGLFIHPVYPYIGPTPGAIIECDFCGIGCLEINCLYFIRMDPVTGNEEGGLKWLQNTDYTFYVLHSMELVP